MPKVTDPKLLAELEAEFAKKASADNQQKEAPAYPSDAVPIFPYRGPDEVPQPNWDDPLARFFTGTIGGLSLGYSGVQDAAYAPGAVGPHGEQMPGPADNFMERVAGGAGHMVGVAPALIGMTAMGVPGPLALAALGAAEAGTPQERAFRAATGAALGAGMHAIAPLAGAAGSAVGGELGRAGAIEAANAPATRALLDYLTFTQMRAAGGEPLGEAAQGSIGDLVGSRALPPAILGRDPSVQSGERTTRQAVSGAMSGEPAGGFAAPPMRQRQSTLRMRPNVLETLTEPDPAVPSQVVMSKYLRGETVDWLDAVRELAAAGQGSGGVSEQALSQTRKTMAAERRAERAALKEENAQREAEGKKPKKIPAKLSRPISDREAYARTQAESTPQGVRDQVSAGDVGDVTLSQFRDKRRTLNRAGVQGGSKAPGGSDNPVVSTTQRTGELAEIFRDKMEADISAEYRAMLEDSGIKPGSAESSVLTQLVDIFKYGSDPVEFFAAEGRPLLESLPVGSRQPVMDAAIRWRAANERVAEARDLMNRGWVGRPFEGREAYVTKIEKKASILRHPLDRLEQATRPNEYIPEAARKGKFGPQKVRSPYEKPRSDKEYKYGREWDAYKVLEPYIADTARKLAYQAPVSAGHAVSLTFRSEARMGVRNAKAAVRAAKEMGDDAALAQAEIDLAEAKTRARGLERTAEAVNGVMQASYNDQRYGTINKVTDRMQRSRPGVAAYKMASMRKQIFNAAKYKLNLPFIFLRQWSSSGQALGFDGVRPDDLVYAFAESLRPGFLGGRSGDLNAGTYTGYRKSGQFGSMRREGQGFKPRVSLRRPGFWETMDTLTDIPTNIMETQTGKFAAALFERVADRAGLEGRAKRDFISDGISWMQSEYHHESRAEALRNPVVNATFPAQSFAVEVANNLKDASWRRRALLLTNLAMANLVYQYANSYHKDEENKIPFTNLDAPTAQFWLNSMLDNVEATIPYSSAITGRGPSEGQTLTASSLRDIWSGVQYIDKAVSTEDPDEASIYWKRAANEFIKDWVPGGGQISRAVSARAFNERGVISDEELPLAEAFGWWTVEGGQEYLRRLAGIKSAPKPEPYVPGRSGRRGRGGRGGR